MCFSKEMSLCFFFTGIIASYYFRYINKINIFLPMLYFSIMELLQYFGYLVIENKLNKLNKILAIIIHIHIGFQPYFANKWFSNYIPKSKLVFIPFVEKLCIVFGIFWISRLFFVDKSNICNKKWEPNCGMKTKLRKGIRHIIHVARSRGPNYITPSIFMHFFLLFIPILFLGVNKFVYGLVLFSGILGWTLATNIHEAASIWCLLFVPALIISLIYQG